MADTMKPENEKREPTQIVKAGESLPPQLIDPAKQVEFAGRAAKVLMDIIKTKPKKLVLNGEQYIEFEDWQTVARFYNMTVGVDWTREIMREGKIHGFEAKANVYNSGGTIISSAEASCLRDEPKWNTRSKYEYKNGKRNKVSDELVPEFQLKSMAQTRASAKALRNVLAWVVVLAGFKATPAEEMDGVEGFESRAAAPPAGSVARPAVRPPVAPVAKDTSANVPGIPEEKLICAMTGVKITQEEYAYSMRKYGMPLSRAAQREQQQGGGN
ncbi:MAG: hypothetical protein WC445_01060 [Patescibacteria group bacterium]